MRRIVLTVALIVLAAAGFAGWRVWSGLQSPAPVATELGATPSDSGSAAAAAGANGAEPSAEGSDAVLSAEPSDAVPSPSVSGTDVAAASSPNPSASPAAAASDTPSPAPTIPAEPTGLPVAWTQMTERTVDGPEAELVVRTGDINNLGFGWPPHFTPFSGMETPPHPYPCSPRPGAAPGTDRIMLGSGVTPNDLATRSHDGYSECSSRPDNVPQAVPLEIGALPNHVHAVLVQMFLDDFQAPVWHSHFQVSLNGTRIPAFEDTINTLDQTGPIGKLVTLRLLPEYLPILRSGNVNLLIDDPTTGAGDGYAIDFVRVLVNPRAFRYAVSIACSVVDAQTQKPIAGASVSAAQVSRITGTAGTAELAGVPAGLVSVGASAVGYDSAVQLVDLPAGQHGTAAFALKKHREGVDDLKRLVKQNGSVAVYGIHFDTASAALRPDSRASLETVLQLIESIPNSHWTIAGHTDNQGGAAYNLQLSDARAHSVVAWLAAHGIASSRLIAKGYGLTRPIADNATESGRALNRRVEVALTR